MMIDHELPAAMEKRGVETAQAARAVKSRRGGASKVESESSSSFAKIADEVSVRTKAEAPKAEAIGKEKSTKSFRAWQDSDFSVGDFIDIINPLHHVPIVATLYRNFTGDRIGMAPRIIGGALWGRIGGFVSGIVNAAVEWLTGKDIGDHIYAAIWSNDGSTGNSRIADGAHAGQPEDHKETTESAPEVGQERADLLPVSDATMRELRDMTSETASVPELASESSTPTAPRNVFIQLPDLSRRRGGRQAEATETKRAIRWIA